MRTGLTEEQLKAMVYKFGPATIGFNTMDPTFFKLKGPYQGTCFSPVADHAMLVIGWDDKGNWIIKNSYSAHWGLDGFLYTPRSKSKDCDMYRFAAVPFFSKSSKPLKAKSNNESSNNGGKWWSGILG